MSSQSGSLKSYYRMICYWKKLKYQIHCTNFLHGLSVMTKALQPLVKTTHLFQPTLNRQVLLIAQDVIYCASRGQVKTPKHVRLSMTVKHLTGSSQVVSIINKFGHCISDSELHDIDTELAQQLEQERNGRFLPSNILEDFPGCFAWATIISMRRQCPDSVLTIVQMVFVHQQKPDGREHRCLQQV